jgi:hypothetical protein
VGTYCGSGVTDANETLTLEEWSAAPALLGAREDEAGQVNSEVILEVSLVTPVRTARSGSPCRARLPLSDRGELSAGQLRVNGEAERIQQLALLHQPDQNRLPELSKLTAVRMAE